MLMLTAEWYTTTLGFLVYALGLGRIWNLDNVVMLPECYEGLLNHGERYFPYKIRET